jgi:hypothetical protein
MRAWLLALLVSTAVAAPRQTDVVVCPGYVATVAWNADGYPPDTSYKLYQVNASGVLGFLGYVHGLSSQQTITAYRCFRVSRVLYTPAATESPLAAPVCVDIAPWHAPPPT